MMCNYRKIVYMKHNSLIFTLFFVIVSQIACASSPVAQLLERIDKGASRKFVLELDDSGGPDYFELSTDRSGKIRVRGNNNVSLATGVNWYLKYYANIHLSWNCMRASLPERLPAVTQTERHVTDIAHRYYLNYCTLSYSMAFWDWQRWEQEIDWMALHGINLCLDTVGSDVVWRNVLMKLGYTRAEVEDFVAGPAFQAWWLMGNIQAWGGPNSDAWYDRQLQLQRRILKRMKELDINPCLPGYSGMVPNDAAKRLGLDVSDPGLWCDYRRPAFLLPTDKRFSEIASLYYREQKRLFGVAQYYSMDPFHEGGSVEGVDLKSAGAAIMREMKRVNPDAVWVAQGWQSCPHPKMIEGLRHGDLLVLDLWSECMPQWGCENSEWYRKDGYGGHDWAYCMLLNYGGNVGLYGKMRHVEESYYEARASRFASSLKGVGLTMEGIENNPVMYELLSELPWREQSFDIDRWLESYVRMRYGDMQARYGEAVFQKTLEAWRLLARSVYGCPREVTQQGCHESILCARPSLDVTQVSTWSGMTDYYNYEDVVSAARLLLEVAEATEPCDNFRYDMVDVVRQAIAEQARRDYRRVVQAYRLRDEAMLEHATGRFLEILDSQERLLSSMPQFMLGPWLQRAKSAATNDAESRHYEWNARVQITTWGGRAASETGGLHDYAHKEWSGVLRDVCRPRWEAFFESLRASLAANRGQCVLPQLGQIDYYAMDEAWTQGHACYPCEPQGDAVEYARKAFDDVFGK